ncbi:MAG: general secretion pathway protein GspK [Methylococcaceae bacterium]|nr:general secretion pathway protein GspK [Methylococcaceae bacterium]
MSGSFALSMRREASIVEGLKNNAQAGAIAESALAVAEMMLLQPEAAKRWRADGSIYQVDFSDTQVRIQLQAEVGKIDINNANEALLQTLIGRVATDKEQMTKLVNAILDWRDSDDMVRPDGAEKQEYKKAGLNYQPRNKRFRTVEELQMVLGITQEVFETLSPLITVYSGQDVDLRFAPREVLEVLPGLNPEGIEQYLMERTNSAINELPMPSTAMLTAGALNEDQANQAPEDLVQPDEDAAADPATETGVFEIIAEAKLENGSSATLNVQVERIDGASSDPFTIIKWQHNLNQKESLFSDEKTKLLVMQYAEPEFNN